MPLTDYFFPEIALDYTTGLPVPDAEADVYALADTGFTTPLPITDMNGIPLAKLKASPTGIYPAFRCPGYTQVVAKDGGLTTPLTSRYGFILEVVPDPSTADDGLAVGTASGSYTLIPIPGVGMGVRETNVHTTPSLASLGRQLSTITLGKTILILTVAVNKHGRVRMYDSGAHQTADASRAVGVDPDPLSNTGVMLDMELEPADGTWTLTPPAAVFTLADVPAVPITVDNLDGTAGVVEVTITYVVLEA